MFAIRRIVALALIFVSLSGGATAFAFPKTDACCQPRTTDQAQDACKTACDHCPCCVRTIGVAASPGLLVVVPALSHPIYETRAGAASSPEPRDILHVPRSA